MLRRKKVVVFFFFLIFSAPSMARAEFRVIVNKNNGVSTLKRSQIVRIFTKKKTTWEDGRAIEPVDLPKGHHTRDEFSQAVLNKSVVEVESFWMSETLVGGKSAPDILRDGYEIKEFIKGNREAIGYIDADQVDDSIKVIDIEK
jgi:ABC-type phosphate transport system substrate-binding protein